MPLLLEYWKPVVGYENKYEVSNCGRVRPVIKQKKKSRRRYLEGSCTSHGYTRVSLSNPIKIRKMHHLVMEAFIGERPNGKEVNHKDGDKLNNRLSNLEYVTRSENLIHACKHGLRSARRRGKFTEDQARKIRELSATMTKTSLAGILGVTDKTVYNIIKQRNHYQPSSPTENHPCQTIIFTRNTLKE